MSSDENYYFLVKLILKYMSKIEKSIIFSSDYLLQYEYQKEKKNRQKGMKIIYQKYLKYQFFSHAWNTN